MQFAYVAVEIIPYHKSYKKSIFRKSAEWAHEALKSVMDELELLAERLDAEDSKQKKHIAGDPWEELVDEFDAEESEQSRGDGQKVAFNLQGEPRHTEPEPEVKEGYRGTEEEGVHVDAMDEVLATAPPIDRLEAELLQRSAGTKQASDLATANIRSNFLLESAGIKPDALERASRESRLLLTSAQQNLITASSIESKEAKLLLETSKLKLDSSDRSSSYATSSSNVKGPDR